MADSNITLSEMKIQWHPAFCAAVELELLANREELDFQREYNLSKKPMQIDLLVVKKQKGVSIENEIGRIFRQYNVIEYKSPEDGLTIDDVFKTVGYAYIYKSLGERVDQIPIDQLTVSLIRESCPEKLFQSMETYGFTAEKKYEGIYYIKGLPIPSQVVVTRELEREKHRSLRILSRNALEEDICGFVEDAQKLTLQGDRNNIDAVLQASVSANYQTYGEIKGRDPIMCEAMRRLMHDEIAEEVREAQMAGREEGRTEGRAEQARVTALNLFKRGMSVPDIAESVAVSIKLVQEWLAGGTSLAK